MATFTTDTRPIIGRGPSLVARFLLLAAISVGLMVGDHRYQYMNRARAVFSSLVYPMQWLVDAPFRAGHWLTDNVADRNKLRQENAQLRADLRDAQVELQTLAALRAEVARLKDLSDATQTYATRHEVARIMRVDLDPLRHRVLLDKGTADGVFKGQPVLDASGVFGQITQVGENTAEAILISDASHGIPVRVMRSGLRTIAQGTGNLNKLNLPYITGEADIKVGDQLIASGLGGVFPAGYPVATITKVSRDPAQTFAEVEARPNAKLDSDYEVVLLWYQADTHQQKELSTEAAPTTAPVTVKQLEEAATAPVTRSTP